KRLKPAADGIADIMAKSGGACACRSWRLAGVADRDAYGDLRSFADVAPDVARAAEKLGTLADADEAESAGRAACRPLRRDYVGIEADTVVADRQRHHAFPALECQLCLCRLRVLGDIRQRLLGDAVQPRPDRRWQLRKIVCGGNGDGDAVIARELA